MMYTIVVIEALKSSLLRTVAKLTEQHADLGKPQLVLLTSKPEQYYQYDNRLTVIATDYSDESLKQALGTIKGDIKAVICRGDKYVQYLRRVVPHLPGDVLVSNEISLERATNKRLMRQAFAENAPDITPGYSRVKDASETTIQAVVSSLHFPVIIKPASLASSLLIQKCTTQDELTKALRGTFAQLEDIYQKEGRSEYPEIIVEEFMEGDFYSIDSYVSESGAVTHCPPVFYLPANKLGIDDFFLYKRNVPTALSEKDVQEASQAAEKAIAAVGLTYSSVHTELVKTTGGWKIIELGPRLGRFRNIMYRQAYEIDHGYNDVLVHLGIATQVTTELKKHCAAYSIYPTQEGVLEAIVGIEEARGLEGVCYYTVMAQPGDYVYHAKNGGHALSEVIIAHQDKAVFENSCAWFEKNVKAVVKGEVG